MADSFVPEAAGRGTDSFVADPVPAAAPAPITAAERKAYTEALPGEPIGARRRAEIERAHGGREAFLGEYDPHGEWMGQHVVPMLPWALLGAVPGAWPWLAAGPARMAGGALIGAATAEPEARGRQSLTGLASQAVGELGGPVTRVAQRFSSRMFNRLSNEVADRLMIEAKKLVPWWKDLPEGQAGVKALLEDEGTAILSRKWEQAVKSAGGTIPEWAKSTWQDGMNLINALRTMKVLDPATKRLDPEALVTGVATRFGTKKPWTVWERFLSERFSPKARQAVKAVTPSGEAPSVERIPLPFVGATMHHLRAGEHIPDILRWSRNVPYSEMERAVQELAPVAAGALTRGALGPDPMEHLTGRPATVIESR